MKYIQHQERSSSCIFCNALKSQADELNLVVFRGINAFVILNRYPYTSGHLMIVPNAHKSRLSMLDKETQTEVMDLMVQAERVLQVVYQPDGLNMGLNQGSAAGAGIAGHLHFHVVPRWSGDTNFMTAVAGARILPETLEDTLQRLTDAWPLAR
jgi:ATP adenylyltransferase